MSSVEVVVFVIDDDNEAKFWAHGLTAERVSAVLSYPRRLRRNRKARRANYLLIGRDHMGQCLAIPIEPPDDPTIWRPVTAWFCKPSE